jgi:hypothetical protein
MCRDGHLQPWARPVPTGILNDGGILALPLRRKDNGRWFAIPPRAWSFLLEFPPSGGNHRKNLAANDV